jgi:hypothetical protein
LDLPLEKPFAIQMLEETKECELLSFMPDFSHFICAD